MRTFTTVALDRLLEPGGARSTNANPPRRPPVKPQPSPALYTTPKTTSLPDSPTSFSPSPYIINHKRRGPRLLKSLSQPDVTLPPSPPPDDPKEEAAGTEGRGVDGKDIRDGGLRNGGVGDGEVRKVDIENDGVGDGDGDDFFDPLDTASNASSGSFGRELTWKPGTPVGEFYDALEDISSEGTPISSCRNIEDELREMRLNVLMEIERRKQAEESLENLKSRWQRLSHHLSQVGLLLPAPQAFTEEMGGQSDIDPAEVLCQQVIVARSVAAAIGRGCSRAEVELELEPQIESKNFEIARLWDRLHYYEAANREMSQRNQEAVEMARQQRHRRKRRQKWLWSTIGLTIALGTAALARSYFSDSSHLQRKEGDSPVGDGN